MDFRRPQPHWLRPQMGTTTAGSSSPQAYMVALQHVVVTLSADPRWNQWWCASGVPECELGIVAESAREHLRPSADIRKVRGKLRANFTCAAPDAHGRQPAELFPAAVREVTGMFEVIRQALGLAKLPPVPPLPALTDQARRVEVTRRPQPHDADDYPALTRIEEFFVEDQT
jgi:hypothetical protein